MTVAVAVEAERRGLIFAVNPVATLLALLPITLVLLLTVDWVSATVALVLEIMILFAVGVRHRRAWWRTLPVWLAAPLAALTMILYGEPSGATYFSLGIIQITEGSLRLGVATLARVLALAIPSVIIFGTVDPTELGDGLAQLLRLPSRFVLGALAGLRMIGLFIDDWRALELARRARGVADRGRLRRVLGQALALLVLSIRRGSKLATAMEARGFGAPVARTWARPSRLGRSELITMVIGLTVAGLSVTSALLAGTWNPLFD